MEKSSLEKYSFCFEPIFSSYKNSPNYFLQTVEKIVKEFEKFNGPVNHMVGTHCLYNLPREKLIPLLKIPSSDSVSAYYDFSPVPEFRIIVLDSCDVSAIGWPKDHPVTLASMELLRVKNPNDDKNSPRGLVGLERRFVMFNGAFGKKQLQWLDEVLRDSTQKHQNVIICC